MTIDKAKLKALAEAATPGPWERSDGNEVSVSHDGDEAFWCWEEAGPAHVQGDSTQSKADADFIAAANPATLLALLADFDQLKADNEAMRKDAERYRWLRNPDQDVANVIDKMVRSGIYEYRAGDELDSSVDAAMSKEASQ